jgi:hypothetical protein
VNQAQFLKAKAGADISKIFLVFMGLVGDVDRTAQALNLDPEFVERLAEDEGWAAKVRKMCVVAQGDNPGDLNVTAIAD